MSDQFNILRDALWCGEVSEREFIARCADLSIPYERVIVALNELRTEDGIEIVAVAFNGAHLDA